MKRAVAAAGLLALVSAPLTTAQADTTKPEVASWHVWTDAQGVSRQTRCTLTAVAQQSMGGTAPQWNDH